MSEQELMGVVTFRTTETGVIVMGGARVKNVSGVAADKPFVLKTVLGKKRSLSPAIRSQSLPGLVMKRLVLPQRHLISAPKGSVSRKEEQGTMPLSCVDAFIVTRTPE
jgi:hypothetical protein